MAENVRVAANHPAEVIEMVNSIEIDGAIIPFDEPFSEDELQGVSSWAIMHSCYYDYDWDEDYDAEVPSRLAHYIDLYGKMTLFINESINFWERRGSSDDMGPEHHGGDGYPQSWAAQWRAGFHATWNEDAGNLYRNEQFMSGLYSRVDVDDSLEDAAQEALADGSFRLSNTALRAEDWYPQSTYNSDDGYGRVWLPGSGFNYDNGGPYHWSSDTWGNANDGWYKKRNQTIASGTKILVPCMGSGYTGPSVQGWTHQEYANQLKNDRTFLNTRTNKVRTAMQTYGMAVDLDEDNVEELLDGIREAQDALAGDDLTDQEREAKERELADLRSAVSPDNLARRAEQLQALEELRESGEAGEFAAAWRSMEQCFLIGDFVEMSKMSISRKQEYRIDGGPSAHMVHGPMGKLVSTLMFDPNYSTYYFLTPDKLSYLVPRLQFFQVLHETFVPGQNNPTERQIRKHDPPVDFEVPFFQHITDFAINRIMSGQEHGRGGQVSIKSFDWIYQGSNPASSRRDIKATLVVNSQNFQELVRKRIVDLPDPTNPNAKIPHEWTYADLAIRRSRDHQQQPDTLYSQIKVVVGWGMKEGAAEMATMGFTNAEIKAIRNSQMTMFLTIIDHAFDIKDDGSVDFKIEFRAYIEGAFTSPEANVLMTPTLKSNKKKRDEAMAELQASLQDPEGTCRPEDMAELRRRFSQSIQKDKAEAHMALLRGLEGDTPSESRIYVRTIDIVKMMDFMDNPFRAISGDDPANPSDPPSENVAATPDLPQWHGGGATPAPTPNSTANYVDDLEDKINFPDNVNFNNSETPDVNKMMESIYPEENDGEINIPYFFLGDLIDVALNNIHAYDDSTPKRFERMRILLGPLEINSFTNSKVKYQINLADIPISVNYFMEWFLRRIQAKQQVIWYLMDFIKDLVKNMVFDILNSDECFNGAIRQKAKFNNLYLVGSGTSAIDPIQQRIDSASGNNTATYKRLFVDNVTATELPILSVDRSDLNVPASDQYNYVLLYAADPQPANLRGDLKEDMTNGIYHFHIGTNKGLVKRIKFTKTDQPYMREARYFSQGYDGFSILREPYKLDIELYGNSRIFPGMTIYVDPEGLGWELGSPAQGPDQGQASMAWTLGLGGYHMVINAQHSIARGEFSTRINAVWVLRGAEGGETNTSDGAQTPARNTSNCEPLNNYGPPSGYTGEQS